MRLLILGAGPRQLSAIKTAKEKGHTVVVSDYLAEAPGKQFADYAEMTSTFDIAGNIKVAKKYAVDGVLTIATDQPVLTAARVAEALGLPQAIDSDTALAVTNKKFMKKVFAEKGIPSSNYLLLEKRDLEDSQKLLKKLSQLKFPLVAKPLDSQGQRGVYKLERPVPEIGVYLEDTFCFTEEKEIIVEEIFSGEEISVSVWVEDSKPYILMITDRPLLKAEPHFGMPDAHIFPSKYLFSHYQKIAGLTEKIVKAFGISWGPVYLQVLVGAKEVSVVEVACRIGGGHEDQLIPLVTGIDPVGMLIDKSLGGGIDSHQLKTYELLSNDRHAMVKFVIAQPGRVKAVGCLESVKKMPGIVAADFYDPQLKEVRQLINSTRRVGYILVAGSSRLDILEKAELAYREMAIVGENGRNLVYKHPTYGS